MGYHASGSPEETEEQDPKPVIVNKSQAMANVLAVATRAAQTDVKVLVTGESGVGKDLVARHIHAHSSRAHRSMIAVNCAALSETLLESELFGHVKGSFTGAYRDKLGKLQLAHRGTIFLDEIGEMSLRMQALLLRVLENGEIQPVGSDRPVANVDVRLIAATNRDLDALVADGRFREDLLYRVKVAHIHVPGLRERPEDIRPLVESIARQRGRRLTLSEEAWTALEHYHWPGNVRELQNVVDQLVWMSSQDLVTLSDLPPAIRAHDSPRAAPAKERRRQVADDLFSGLVGGRYDFWSQLHPLFLSRDITRNDLRELVRRGLAATHGSYRELMTLFRMGPQDYKRFLNFLATHECGIDYREFRVAEPGRPEPQEPPPFIPWADLPDSKSDQDRAN
jgi:transcriptional regulator with PAS, ATPase and Fis domain